MIGQNLLLATILDNVGGRPNLVNPALIESTCRMFPREGWSEHFATVIEKELSLKPWCHTSALEPPNWCAGMRSDAANNVRKNQLMQQFDSNSSTFTDDPYLTSE